MSNYLIVLDGTTAQPQVAEFLAGVQDRTPRIRFYLLVAAGDDRDAWPDAAQTACASLETLRAAGLELVEAIVGEPGRDAISDELARPDRSYECILRFTPFRRGIHIQRITPASKRHGGREERQPATPAVATAASSIAFEGGLAT